MCSTAEDRHSLFQEIRPPAQPMPSPADPHLYSPYDTDSDGYYCEDGTWVTAVQSGISYWELFGVYHGYTAGPKARDIRDWVIAYTQ